MKQGAGYFRIGNVSGFYFFTERRKVRISRQKFVQSVGKAAVDIEIDAEILILFLQ